MSSSKHQKLSHLLNNAVKQSPQKTVIYTIKHGDTLSEIIRKHYHATPNTLLYSVAQSSVLEFNPHINHPDKINAGDSLRLMPLPDIHSAGSWAVASHPYQNS